MAVNLSAWDTHRWSKRRLDLGGVSLIQHICPTCGRNFVDELKTGARYAVYVGATRFERLSDEITTRWLVAPCPGTYLESDEVDLETRFASAEVVPRERRRKRTG